MRKKMVLSVLCRKRSGMTLVELIVAIAITSIVLVVAFSIQVFGNRAFVLGESKSTVQLEARTAADYITREIRYATSVELLSAVPGTVSESNTAYIYVDTGTQDIVYKDSSGTRTIADFDTVTLTFTATGKTLYFNIQGDYRSKTMDLDSKVLPINMSKHDTIINAGGTSTSIVKFTMLPKGNSMFGSLAATPTPTPALTPAPTSTPTPTVGPTSTPVVEELVIMITLDLFGTPVQAAETAKKGDILYAYVYYNGPRGAPTKTYRWFKNKNNGVVELGTNSSYTVRSEDKGDLIYLEVNVSFPDGTTKPVHVSHVSILQN